MFENISQIACDFGLFFDQNSRSFNLISNLFPKVSFLKNQQLLRLYYNGPNGFGLQYFDFDFYDFLLAFEQKKFKHSTPKNDYSDFISSFTSISNSRLNDRVKFVFNFFYINPTVLKKAIHQNKKMKRKITLKPNLNKLFKALS